jgi:hypothetical protein
LGILAVITLIEVGISLFGKGHIIEGVQNNKWVVSIAALLIIILSLYKARFIIFEFMHMKHEVPTLAKTVLLPMVLLIWAMIAFFYEGNAWKQNRVKVNLENKRMDKGHSQTGMIIREWPSKNIQ